MGWLMFGSFLAGVVGARVAHLVMSMMFDVAFRRLIWILRAIYIVHEDANASTSHRTRPRWPQLHLPFRLEEEAHFFFVCTSSSRVFTYPSIRWTAA